MGMNRAFDVFFLEAQLLIENSLDSEQIIEIMERYGYSKRRITEGRELLELAKRRQSERVVKQAQSKREYARYHDELKRAKSFLAKLVKLSRIALGRESSGLNTLGIDKPWERSVAAWLVGAEFFYSQALEEERVSERLAAAGVNRERLLEGRELLERAKDLHVEKVRYSGEAQMATKARDRALKELKRWHDDYRATARIALKEVPQLMEVVGIVEKS